MATTALVSITEYLNTSYRPDQELLEGQSDVCVISREQPLEPVFTKPPLLVIEVLSKDDTLRSMQERIDDYRAFGIQTIWVLDPVKRRAYSCTNGDFREPRNQTLDVPGSPIHFALQDLFSELDRF